MATQAELVAISNFQLQSQTQIPASKHRIVNDSMTSEMYNPQSRGDVLAGVQEATSLVAGDEVFVIRSGAAFLLDAGTFGFVDKFEDLTDVTFGSPSNTQIVNFNTATSKLVFSDPADLFTSDLSGVNGAAETDIGTNGTGFNATNRYFARSISTYTASTTQTLTNATNLNSFTQQITNTNANVLTFAGITLHFNADQLPSGVSFASNALTFPADSAVKYNLFGVKMNGIFDCKIEIR